MDKKSTYLQESIADKAKEEVKPQEDGYAKFFDEGEDTQPTAAGVEGIEGVGDVAAFASDVTIPQQGLNREKSVSYLKETPLAQTQQVNLKELESAASGVMGAAATEMGQEFSRRQTRVFGETAFRPGVCLIALDGADQDREWVLEGETITLGRDPYCDVVLRDASVSRMHGRLQRVPFQEEGLDTLEGAEYSYTDLGSANGSFLNTKKISATVPISSGSTIMLGTASFRLIATGDVIAPSAGAVGFTTKIKWPAIWIGVAFLLLLSVTFMSRAKVRFSNTEAYNAYKSGQTAFYEGDFDSARYFFSKLFSGESRHQARAKAMLLQIEKEQLLTDLIEHEQLSPADWQTIMQSNSVVFSSDLYTKKRQLIDGFVKSLHKAELGLYADDSTQRDEARHILRDLARKYPEHPRLNSLLSHL